MSRIMKPCWVICCAPLLGWVGSATAGDTAVVGANAYWVAEAGRAKASDTPTHRVLAPFTGVPEQRVLRVDCFAAAYKALRRGVLVPRKGARVAWDIYVVCPAGLLPDVGFDPYEYLGVISGVVRTDSTGVATFSATLTGKELPPPDHEHAILASVIFVNQKRVLRTEAGCEVSLDPP